MSSDVKPQKLLVIGWDAADWMLITPLMDAGLMPNLAKLVEGGVIGNLATLRPCLSPMLWTSIATGKLADKHGILGFIEPTPDGNGVRLSSSTSRKSKALWNIFSQNKLKTHCVAWYASHPAEPINGVCVSDQFMGEIRPPGQPWPPREGAVHPADLVEPIASLRVHPAEIRDSDLLPFIPRLKELDPNAHLVQQLAVALSKAASVQAVATGILDAEPWDVLHVYFDCIDVVGHDFMLYHPPRLPHISENDFDLYQQVMNGLYQFHDMMLGRVLQMVGDDTAVVLLSDHGFHSDHLRPNTTGRERDSEETAALWHRHYGVLVMRGKGLKKDERVYGATILDVAPTILTMMGLPVGNDMDGKVLVDAFEKTPEIRRIPSWDDNFDGGGDPGLHPADLRQDVFLAAEAIDQLIALGYLPEPARDQKLAADVARREAKFNLAATHLFVGRGEQARAILEELVAQHPEESRYQLWLGRAYASLMMHRDCADILTKFREKHGPSPDADLLRASALFNAGDRETAKTVLGEIETKYLATANLRLTRAAFALVEKDYSAAAQAYEEAAKLDPDSEKAHFGLACSLNGLQQFERAADHALRAVGLIHFFPAAHYQLGVALEGLGDTDRAIKSMEAAVHMSPNMVDAHRHLARIHHARGDIANALKHERAAEGYGVARKA